MPPNRSYRSCAKNQDAGAPVKPWSKMEKLSTQVLTKRLDRTQELPTLSAVAMQVNQMLQDIETSAQKLAKVIEIDQAIAPKLLKLVNSAFFGFSSKVSSVSHAVMLLGFNTVRNAVLSIAVIDGLDAQKKLPDFDMLQFWRHAIGVAVSANHLDKQTGGRCRENAFTAGLIHDIGKIVMAQFFTDHMALALQVMSRDRVNFGDAEQCYFAMGHAAIGAYLARRWNLPDAMTRAIKRHHSASPKDDALPLIVHTADALVHTHLEQDPEERAWPIHTTAWELLGKQIETAELWMPSVRSEIDDACKIFLKE